MLCPMISAVSKTFLGSTQTVAGAVEHRAGRRGTEAHPGLPVIVGFGRDSGGSEIRA